MKTEHNDVIYYHALNSISLFGPRRIATLLENYGTAEQAWQAPVQESAALLDLGKNVEKLEQERRRIDPLKLWVSLQEQNIKCISPLCTGYPILLNQIACPPLIYYRGSLEKIDLPAVSIVGSRRCTFYGREVAHRLAAELAGAGVTVVSGMALGIDTAAHQGTLENSGYTVAVLGCGVDTCYPPRNAELMERIVNEGALLSEFPPGTKPRPAHFPQRNRIISGLSLGTVVVEATAKSGSLITANYALEQNREVFAVPGNVGSPYSLGSHRLIKDGARLVESASDILEELYIGASFGLDTEEQLTIDMVSANFTPEEKTLLGSIPYQPIHIDNIIRQSGLKASEVSTTLLSLELKKSIRQTPGKYFSRI